jgi:diacylglycerol kinase family enzyme
MLHPVANTPVALLVSNPRACGGASAALAAPAIRRLRTATRVAQTIETNGDGDDARRIAEAAEKTGAELVVVAGGDGTIALAVAALLAFPEAARPALAILPIGTGNNAARSFGLRALRDGDRAIALALAAIERGARRSVDVGFVDERPFLGSFALGLDGEILRARNRLAPKLAAIGVRSDYGLYLASFALCFATARQSRFDARLVLDGVGENHTLFNAVVTNAPVYAGPLRFDGATECADGLLDLHATESASRYVAEYPQAWIRYLRVLRGSTATASPLLCRAREIVIEPDRPVAALVDGEELQSAASYRIRVLPRAIRICTPPVTTTAASTRSR